MLTLMKSWVAISGFVAAACCETRDLQLLGREVVTRLVDAPARVGAGCQQLDPPRVAKAPAPIDSKISRAAAS